MVRSPSLRTRRRWLASIPDPYPDICAAAVRSQQLCLVPGCSDPGVPAAGKQDRLLCQTHRRAASIYLDGTMCRFCAECKSLHPVDDFPPGKNLCKVAEARIFGMLRRTALERCRVEAEDEKQQWFVPLRRLVKACSTADSWHGIPADPGRQVWARGIVRFLRGGTVWAKLAIAIAYPTAAWLLGWETAEAWIAVVGMFMNLHVLMPFVHRHVYAKGLDRCRREAGECRLVVDQAFRLLDPQEDAKYEMWAERGRRTSDSVALFMYAACFILQSAWGFHKSWGTDPMMGIAVLLLIGAAYFPLQEHARATGQHGLRHWLESTLVFIARQSFAAAMFCSWLVGHRQCGLPASATGNVSWRQCIMVLTGGCVWVLEDVVLACLAQWPLPFAAGGTLLRWATGLVLFPTCLWCIEAESGMAFSTSLSLQMAAVWMAVALAYTAVRIKVEQRKLLRYIRIRQAKESHAVDVLSDGEDEEDEEQSFLRASFKIGGATPADLQPDLRERLAAALKVKPESLTGVIRPGCILLGVTVRCETPGGARSAWAGMLSHEAWGDTLLQPTGGIHDLSLSCHGSRYRVEGGRLDYVVPQMEAPSVSLVTPTAALLDCDEVRFCVEGLAGSSFKVLMRTARHYYELPIVVEERRRPGAPTIVAVRIPGGAQPAGLGWLEVMVDTEDSSLVLSEGVPMMFTPWQDVAAEVNRQADQPGSTKAAVGLLEGLSDCLHHGVEAPPRLLLKVIRLGLTACFNRMATRSALRTADAFGQGVLGAAAQSGSEQMVEAVIRVLRRHRLPIEPWRQAADYEGYTALHWAAGVGNCGCIYQLLAETPRPQEAWGRLQSRRRGAAPSDIMDRAGGGFFLDEDVLAMRIAERNELVGEWLITEDIMSSSSCHSCSSVPGHGVRGGSNEMDGSGGLGETLTAPTNPRQGDSVIGGRVVGALRAHTTMARLCCLAVYTAAVILCGWREPLTWVAIVMAWVTLHCMLPYVHREVYVKGLEEARALAARCGLRVSEYLFLVDAPSEQMRYEQYAARRARSGIVVDTCSMILAHATLIAPPAGDLLAALVSKGAGYVPAALGCVGLAVRAWAMCSGRYTLWQWMGTALEYYSRLMYALPALYWVLTGQVVLPYYPTKLILLAPTIMMVASFVLIWLVLTLGQRQPVGGRLAVVSEACFLAVHSFLFTPGILYYIRGREWHVSMGLVWAFAHAAHRVALLGHRLREEQCCLCAFLRPLARKAE